MNVAECECLCYCCTVWCFFLYFGVSDVDQKYFFFLICMSTGKRMTTMLLELNLLFQIHKSLILHAALVAKNMRF